MNNKPIAVELLMVKLLKRLLSILTALMEWKIKILIVFVEWIKKWLK